MDIPQIIIELINTFKIFIFGFSVICIYVSAEPVQIIRQILTKLAPFDWLKSLISCNQCSSFWLGFLIFLIYPIIPNIVQYSTILYTGVIIFELIYYKYFD